MFHLDAVFFEDAVVQSGLEMGKTTGNRAGSDPDLDQLFPGLGQIGIGVGCNGENQDKEKRYQKTPYDWHDTLRQCCTLLLVLGRTARHKSLL